MNLSPDALAEIVVTTIKNAIDGPLVHGRIAALEARVAALEAEPRLRFRGVYQDPAQYSPGDAVTRQGGLWICEAATSGAFDHECWVLAVKKGAAQ